MQNAISKPKAREGAIQWMLKVFGGVVVLIVLAVHFIINHIVAPGGLLTYNDVLRYYQVPIVPIMEVIFLVVVVVHSLLGIRSILLDLNPSNRVLKLIDVAAILLGTVAITYGTWLVFVVVGRGGSI